MSVVRTGTAVCGLAMAWAAFGFSGDLKAGPNDPSFSFFQNQANPGEVVVLTDGPNGFAEVSFFDTNGNLISGPFETSTANQGNTPPPGGNNQNAGAQQYADTSAFLNAPFLAGGLFKVPEIPETGIFTKLKDKRCELFRLRGIQIAVTLALADDGRDSVIADRAAAELRTINKLLVKMKCKRDIDGNIIPASGPPQALTTSSSFKIKPAAGGGVSQLSIFGSGAYPWAMSASVSYSGLDDRRVNSDRKADLVTLVTGGSVQLTDLLSVGLSGYVRTGTVKSTALLSKLDGTYFGISALAKYKIGEHWATSLSVGYSHGDNKVNLNGATGKFDTNALDIAASVNGKYAISEFTLAPTVSVGLSRFHNKGFVASNGVVTPSRKLTLGSLTFGGSLSRSFVTSQGITITPSVGATGVYAWRSGGALALINGANAGQVGLGAQLSPGLDIGLPGGAFVKVSGNVGLFSNITSYGTTGQVSIPLN